MKKLPILVAAAGALGAAAIVSQAGDPPPLLARDALAALEGARAIDLTHPIDARTPHWPGEGADFHAEDVATFEKGGYFARAVRLPEHYGTHVDAPNHFVAGRPAVDAIPPDRLIGEAIVIDLRERAKKDPDALLEPDDVAALEKAHGEIPRGAIVLVHTGWSTFANDPARYQNRDAEGRMRFPGISAEAARVLVERGVRGVGIDTLSIDRGISTDFEAHKVLGAADVWAIENLTEDLRHLPPRGALVVALPAKLRGGSGGPVRVVAFVR